MLFSFGKVLKPGRNAPLQEPFQHCWPQASRPLERLGAPGSPSASVRPEQGGTRRGLPLQPRGYAGLFASCPSGSFLGLLVLKESLECNSSAIQTEAPHLQQQLFFFFFNWKKNPKPQARDLWFSRTLATMPQEMP